MILLKNPSQAFFSFLRFWRFSDKPKFVTALNFPPHDFAVLDIDGGGQAMSRRVRNCSPSRNEARTVRNGGTGEAGKKTKLIINYRRIGDRRIYSHIFPTGNNSPLPSVLSISVSFCDCIFHISCTIRSAHSLIC